jgi:uncharacterized protein (TIGR02757 family)
MIVQSTIDLLLEKFEKYNNKSFIELDPISIPHFFTKKQDIEISGFIAATLAWGQRPTIIANSRKLLKIMDDSPYDFVKNATENDLKNIEKFVHRTFNGIDALYFISFFKEHYKTYDSLETAFLLPNQNKEINIKNNLLKFKNYFFDLEYAPYRTQKHVSSPIKNSACKRINMFLRWMVRKDNSGVDFGIWNNIKTSQLIIPCDLHVERVAKILKLSTRPKADWKTAEEITENLKLIDKTDPVKFDFALFGMGIEKYFDGF